MPATTNRSPTIEIALLTFILPGISFLTSKAMPSDQPGISVLTSRPTRNVYPFAPAGNVPATFLGAKLFTRLPELVAIRIGPRHLCRTKCENGNGESVGIWNLRNGSRGNVKTRTLCPPRRTQRDAAPARSKAGPRQVNYRMSCPSGFIAGAESSMRGDTLAKRWATRQDQRQGQDKSTTG
jgi:hypothetical protein